jgi:hypothetical protein
MPLSKSFLKEWGGDFQNKAPLFLIDAWRRNMRKIKTSEMKDIVFLSRVLSHPSNLGLQGIRNMVVSKVNGTPLKSLAQLKAVLNDTSKNVVKLTLQPGNVPLWLSPKVLISADPAIKRRYGITRLSSD